MPKLPIAVLLLSAAAFSAQAQVKPEDHIKQRRAGFAVLGFNFANLGAMVQGKKPYDQDEAARNADLVAALAEYPHTHFVEGTEKGDTKARPELWKNRADFDEKMRTMVKEAKDLPAAARKDLAALRKEFGEAGRACKACHDEYRAK